jgi:hypothetical protein
LAYGLQDQVSRGVGWSVWVFKLFGSHLLLAPNNMALSFRHLPIHLYILEIIERELMEIEGLPGSRVTAKAFKPNQVIVGDYASGKFSKVELTVVLPDGQKKYWTFVYRVDE